MSDRKDLLKSISETIADYREGDVPRRDPAVIERWVRQFPESARDEILAEMNQLLRKTYISRDYMTKFLGGLTTNEKFCGGDPRDFWKRANLLDIQQGGNSQRELLAMFDRILEQELGLTLANCASDDGPFIYIDDGVFGGGRVLQDLAAWIRRSAPAECEVRIVVAARHTLGVYYVQKRIEELKRETGKKVKLSWWRIHEIENRMHYRNQSDVLWPTVVPDGRLADEYVRYITEVEPKFKVFLRTGESVGAKKFYSSNRARILLEQQFLMAGLNIRDMCPKLPETARPLGATLLKTLGFGSTIVTFRNCPNNGPLALWVGDPWYPLFPRSTNSDAFVERMLESFRGGTARKR